MIDSINNYREFSIPGSIFGKFSLISFHRMAVETKIKIDLGMPISFDLFNCQSIWHRSQIDEKYDELWTISKELMFIGEIYWDNHTEPGIQRVLSLVEGIQQRYQTMDPDDNKYSMLINFPLMKIVVILSHCSRSFECFYLYKLYYYRHLIAWGN